MILRQSPKSIQLKYLTIALKLKLVFFNLDFDYVFLANYCYFVLMALDLSALLSFYVIHHQYFFVDQRLQLVKVLNFQQLKELELNQHFILIFLVNFLTLFIFSFFNFFNPFIYFFSLIILQLFFVFALFFLLFLKQKIYQANHIYCQAIDLIFNLDLFLLNFFMSFYLLLFHFNRLQIIFFQLFRQDLIIFKSYMLNFLYSFIQDQVIITNNELVLLLFAFSFDSLSKILIFEVDHQFKIQDLLIIQEMMCFLYAYYDSFFGLSFVDLYFLFNLFLPKASFDCWLFNKNQKEKSHKNFQLEMKFDFYRLPYPCLSIEIFLVKKIYLFIIRSFLIQASLIPFANEIFHFNISKQLSKINFQDRINMNLLIF